MKAWAWAIIFGVAVAAEVAAVYAWAPAFGAPVITKQAASAASPHPYFPSANVSVAINAPLGAQELRLNFSRLELGSGDRLVIQAAGGEVVTYHGPQGTGPFWTDWLAGASATVTLEAGGGHGSYYGFAVAEVEGRYTPAARTFLLVLCPLLTAAAISLLAYTVSLRQGRAARHAQRATPAGPAKKPEPAKPAKPASTPRGAA